MKKTDLIKEISNGCSFSQYEVKEVLETFESFLGEALQKEEDGEKIKLGIGYFHKTEHGQPKFSPSPKFINKVNGVKYQPRRKDSDTASKQTHKEEPSQAPQAPQAPTKKIAKVKRKK